jgi:hypothetical protein
MFKPILILELINKKQHHQILDYQYTTKKISLKLDHLLQYLVN